MLFLIFLSLVSLAINAFLVKLPPPEAVALTNIKWIKLDLLQSGLMYRLVTSNKSSIGNKRTYEPLLLPLLAIA